MNPSAICINPLDLPVNDRIHYYEQEIDHLTPPMTFREELLCNVYHYLLEQCERQQAA